MEKVHLILTNSSFERDFKKHEEVANRVGLCIIFLFVLIGTTWYVQGDQNGCYYTYRNTTLNCENLCNVSTMDCLKPVLSLADVRYWTYFNWSIFAIACVRLFKGNYCMIINIAFQWLEAFQRLITEKDFNQ